MKSLNLLLLPIAAILLISPFSSSEDINSTVSSTAAAKVSEPTSGTIPTTLSSPTTIKREKPTQTITTVPTTSVTFKIETTTSLPPPLPSTSPLLSVSTPKPEGLSNVPCKSLNDCRSDKGLKCSEGLCRCEHPKVFDIRQQLCIIPLGAECNSELSDKESHCPEFAECFLDRCVCKTGYSMHTLTKCKSDVLDRKTVLWPKPKQDNSDKSSCTPASCDESKGLKCQDGGACKCKDSKEIFVEEFGRCLNTVMQKTLKDALALVSSSELDVKSFVKLLEKFDESDQATGASDNYSSPVHQLVSLLGGSENGKVLPGIKRSQADPYGFGDFYAAAQEPVGESAFPDDGGEKLGGGEVGSSVSSPTQHSFPISPTHHENLEPLAYSRESGENLKKPETSQRNYLPLDNYQPQSQEPAIVQRQAPAFGGQHQQGHGGHGIPGFGGIHPGGGGGFGMPFGPGGLGHGHGLGGLGHHGFGPGLGGHGFGHGLGHHGLGGHGLGGHGLGHHELGGHHGGLGGHQGGGFGGGQGGFGGGQQGGGFGGGQGGFGGGHQGGGFGGGQGGFGGGQQGGGFGGGQGGFGGLGGGLGHGGGHQGGFGGHHGGLGQQGLGGAGGFGGGGFGGGGGGGLGGGHHGGHHHGGHGHGLNKDGLLVDVAEFVGRSLKLIDRFLPLAHALNDVLKKDPHLQHKQDGGLIDGQRARRFGENGESSKEDLFKEGGILSGFTKFVGVLMRLKGRLETSGGNEPLKQLLL